MLNEQHDHKSLQTSDEFLQEMQKEFFLDKILLVIIQHTEHNAVDKKADQMTSSQARNTKLIYTG